MEWVAVKGRCRTPISRPWEPSRHSSLEEWPLWDQLSWLVAPGVMDLLFVVTAQKTRGVDLRSHLQQQRSRGTQSENHVVRSGLLSATRATLAGRSEKVRPQGCCLSAFRRHRCEQVERPVRPGSRISREATCQPELCAALTRPPCRFRQECGRSSLCQQVDQGLQVVHPHPPQQRFHRLHVGQGNAPVRSSRFSRRTVPGWPSAWRLVAGLATGFGAGRRLGSCRRRGLLTSAAVFGVAGVLAAGFACAAFRAGRSRLVRRDHIGIHLDGEVLLDIALDFGPARRRSRVWSSPMHFRPPSWRGSPRVPADDGRGLGVTVGLACHEVGLPGTLIFCLTH